MQLVGGKGRIERFSCSRRTSPRPWRLELKTPPRKGAFYFFGLQLESKALALKDLLGCMYFRRLLMPVETVVLANRERRLTVAWNVIVFVIIDLATIAKPFVPTSAVVFNEVNSFVAISGAISAAVRALRKGAFHVVQSY